MNPKIAVGICTYNPTHEKLNCTARSITTFLQYGFEVFVFDFSKDHPTTDIPFPLGSHRYLEKHPGTLGGCRMVMWKTMLRNSQFTHFMSWDDDDDVLEDGLDAVLDAAGEHAVVLPNYLERGSYRFRPELDNDALDSRVAGALIPRKIVESFVDHNWFHFPKMPFADDLTMLLCCRELPIRRITGPAILDYHPSGFGDSNLTNLWKAWVSWKHFKRCKGCDGDLAYRMYFRHLYFRMKKQTVLGKLVRLILLWKVPLMMHGNTHGRTVS